MPARYLESYGYGDDDDDRWLPPRWHDPWDDIELPEDDYDYFDYPKINPSYYMYFDRKTHTWRCDCPSWRNTGKCFHAYRFRGEEILEINEKYL